MFLAHLPAGFILSHVVARRSVTSAVEVPAGLLLLGMIASVLPDLDMSYYYFVEHRARSHHYYWTHLPLFWISLYSVSIVASMVLRKQYWQLPLHIFFLNILLHCVLDSTAGGIRWLYPWDLHFYRFTTVPAVSTIWFVNFVRHWSFILELLIIALAIWTANRYYRERIRNWFQK